MNFSHSGHPECDFAEDPRFVLMQTDDAETYLVISKTYLEGSSEGLSLDLDLNRLSLTVSTDCNSAEERNHFSLPAATGLFEHRLQLGTNRVA